jgi:hypothetical protein
MSIYCNPYIEIIKKIAIQNKYTKWYINICINAQLRAATKKDAKRITEKYIEEHHILPESFNLGGKHDVINFAYLTAKEHFTCHRLLTKMFLGLLNSKMCWAIKRLSYSKYGVEDRKVTSRTYEKIKLNANAATSKALKGKPQKLKSAAEHKSWTNKISVSSKGRKLSKEHKEKLKKPKSNTSNMKGRNVKSSTKIKLKNGRLGKIANNETKLKQSQIALNRNKIYCIHCDKNFDPFNYRVWHGDKCSMITTRISKPKSENHKNNLSIMQLNQPKLCCIYCKNIINKRIFTRYHGTKCKHYNIQLRDSTINPHIH